MYQLCAYLTQLQNTNSPDARISQHVYAMGGRLQHSSCIRLEIKCTQRDKLGRLCTENTMHICPGSTPWVHVNLLFLVLATLLQAPPSTPCYGQHSWQRMAPGRCCWWCRGWRQSSSHCCTRQGSHSAATRSRQTTSWRVREHIDI